MGIAWFDCAGDFVASRCRSRGGFEEPSPEIVERVTDILQRVRAEGDDALVSLTRELDGVELSPEDMQVAISEIETAYDLVQDGFLNYLREAAAGIEEFHRRQAPQGMCYTTPGGSRLGSTWRPLDRVGAYVPGGSAIYPSSVLMNVIPARVAGVQEIILCSPPSRGGTIDPHILVAAAEAGARRIFRLGGAQAVAALAYGTGSVPRVDKIIGPGNIYVTAAKKLVFGQVAIDGLHGPSEVAILADGSADPGWVAADLLAQAEHDPLAVAVLITPSVSLARETAAELDRQLLALPRGDVSRRALEENGAIVLVEDLDEGVEVLNALAPEHAQLMVRDPAAVEPRVANAGALFIGPFTPVPLGDYGVGPNHVLPTGGTARFFSPLGVVDFLKRMNFMEASESDLRRWAPWVSGLAGTEGLEAHRRAVLMRTPE